MLRLLTLGLFLLLGSPVALAYEGAGRVREEEPPPPPKQPTLTKPPAVVKPVEAVYPESLLTQGGPGGSVKMVIEIGADGHVPNATVTQSSGFPELDAAAVTAIKQFEFSPAELDGKPAAIQLEYVFNFEPRPPPPPPPPDAPPAPKPVNFKGRVLERGTRNPLPNAVVYLPELDLHAETNAEGEFEVRGVPAGKVKVEITEIKHRKFESVEEVKEGEVTVLTAYIWKQMENGFETTIRSEREKKEVARRTLTRDELKTVPGTFGDPIRVIQNLPGVLRSPYLSGALLVRGAQPQDTSVLIDGVPVPLLFHFGGGPSVINPSFIDKIDFYPGAYGAKYGRAIAGVVDVGTRPPSPQGYHGNIGIDLLQSNFYLEGPVKKGSNLGSWSIAARRSYIDLLLPPLLSAVQQPGQATIVASPRYWDYQARYDVDIGANKLEFMAFGSDDVLTVAQAGSAETQGFSLGNHQGFHRARIKVSRKVGDGWSVFLAPTVGTTLVDFNFNDQIKGNISSLDYNVRGGIAKDLLPNLHFETGIDLNANYYTLSFLLPDLPRRVTFPGEEPDMPSVQRDFKLHTLSQAAYSEVVYSPIERLKLIGGLRLEIYEGPGDTRLSLEPRIAARFALTPSTTLKAAWGIYRQPPQPMQLDSVYGNPKLALSKSEQSVLGFEQKLADRLTLDVQGYYNWRSALVVNSRQDELIYDNTGYGKAYGLEVLLKQDITERMFGWVSYTLQRSLQKDFNRNEYVPISFDQTHLLTIVWSYKFDHGIELGTRFRLTTGRPTQPVIGATFNADLDRYTAVAGVPGSTRGATFHQLDIRIEKQWTFTLWRFSTYLDIQNVYNAQNPEFLLYDYRYNKTAPLRGLPFLPTFGIAGAF